MCNPCPRSLCNRSPRFIPCGFVPSHGWFFPLFGGVPQDHINQFHSRIIDGKMPPAFDRLAQLHVQALDRVRCVDHLPNLRRVTEERDHFLPIALPTLPDHRIFLPQATLLELLEPLPSHRRAFCPVDILQHLRHRLALFPTAKNHTVGTNL